MLDLSFACSNIGWVLGFYVVYLLSLAIYRLYLSPIANIPGSKLAAATGWYETYFDVVKGGQFTFQIEKWHKQFGMFSLEACLKATHTDNAGPIIRINPTEIHIADPEFFDVLYSQRTPFDKIERFNIALGRPLQLKRLLNIDCIMSGERR